MSSPSPDTIEAVAAAGTAGREPPAELLDLLRRVQRPLLAGHVAPDADSIGSCAALCVALREQGRDALVALPGGRPANKLRFLVDLAGRDVFGDGAPDGRDALIVFDTTGPKRLNIPFDLLVMPPGSVVNIDHHISNLRYGGINWIDANAGSSAELACRLLKALDWATTPTVATLLFAGLHADTLGFCAPTTTAAALASAADLVRAGADAGLVGEHLYRSQNRAEFDLARRVYDRDRLITKDPTSRMEVPLKSPLKAAKSTVAQVI